MTRRLLPHGVEPSTDDGDVLTTVGGVTEWAPAAGGGLEVEEGGVSVASGVTKLNFTGDITATDMGGGEVEVDVTASGGGVKTACFKVAGGLFAGVGVTRLYNDTGASWTLLSVRATVETAPSGGSVVTDVHKNGTTVFTTQSNRPSITTGNNTSGAVTAIDVTTVSSGDYLTVDIDSTTSPAANLTVIVTFS